jgi:hypothetical protein
VLVLRVQHLLVERQPLVVQRVPQPGALRVQVALVVRVGRVHDRDLLGDRQAVAFEPDDLLRVVGHDPDRAEPEVDEDLRPDAVVAQVDR